MSNEHHEITIYAIVHTAADADRGCFCDPEISGCYLSLSAAKEDWRKQISDEKALLDDRYDHEECTDTCWEMYQDGYAAACFSRIEIIPAKLHDDPPKCEEV